MVAGWTHAVPSILAAFLASLVEFVEALTVILAVGSVRGWRDALGGCGAALVVLLALVVALGSALTHIPLTLIQTVVGILLLLFGLRWLRKAILRAVGVIPLNDETAVFARETARQRALGRNRLWDKAAFGTSFQITMLDPFPLISVAKAFEQVVSLPREERPALYRDEAWRARARAEISTVSEWVTRWHHKIGRASCRERV